VKECQPLVVGNDLLVFGGAAADKTYLSDTWRLPSVHLDAFAYSKRIKLIGRGSHSFTLELNLSNSRTHE
jgi:hypothetical protein